MIKKNVKYNSEIFIVKLFKVHYKDSVIIIKFTGYKYKITKFSTTDES